MDLPACDLWHVDTTNQYIQELDEDISSIGTVAEEQKDDDDADLPIKDHYLANLAHFNRLLQDSQTIDIDSDAERKLIIIPKASKLPSIVLHPVLYRELGPLQDAEALARRLGAEDWLQTFADVQSNLFVQRAFQSFVLLPDDAQERLIEMHFGMLIFSIATSLKTAMTTVVLKYGVGGLLADPNYGYRGITDSCLRNSDTDRMILKTEFKSNLTFPVGHLWYHGSRGAQLFGALYAQNILAPTLLLTHRQFKLFIESKDRKQILAFPPEYDMARIQQFQNSDFLKVLVICVLVAATPESKQQEPAMSPERPSIPIPPAVPPTAKKRKKKAESSTNQSTGSSTRSTRNPAPMYRFSAPGEQEAYRPIWILSDQELDEIAKQLGESGCHLDW